MTSYGIQMYSVRDIAEKDMREALKRLSEMGYRYIEFAGFLTIPQRRSRHGWMNSGWLPQAHIPVLRH